MADELHIGAGGELFWYSRTNRKAPTRAEQKLWSAIRSRKLGGFKFRRQHPINDFIADFYCHECKTVIELDGKYHLQTDQAEYDEGRTFELTEVGITVIRFTNEEVLSDIRLVLKKLPMLLISKKEAAHTPPSPSGEGPGMR